MNLLGRILARVTGWERPSADRSTFYSPMTAAGVSVTPDSALKNPVVWACVQYLTKTLGQLPWHAYLRDDKGNALVANTTQVDRLLSTRPNPELGSFNWRQIMLGRALLWGNAYAEIEFDNRNVPYALWPIHPSRVRPRRAADGSLEYEVWNQGGNTVLPASSMFHIRGFGDEAVGYGIIEYAAQSIGWAQATELFSATYFGNGMNVSTVVKAPTGMSPAGLKETRREIDKLYAGPRGKKSAVIDAGMDIFKLQNSPEEGQFIETRYLQVEEICRWFGVPPHKVQHLLRATFSNIEHQSIEVVTDSLTPWARIFEEEANGKLFGANRQGFYTKISMQALLRGDNDSRMKFYKGLEELGVPLNDILALEDMNGIGTDGNVSFVSNNVQTLKRAIEGPKPPAPPATTDKPADQAGQEQTTTGGDNAPTVN